MKKNLLITTAAAAILATTGLATAQDHSGKPAGAMEKAAPQVQMRGASQPRGHEQRPSEPMAEKPAKGMQHSDKGTTPSDKSTHKSMQKSETDRHPAGARRDADAQNSTQHRNDKRTETRSRSETTGRGDTSVRFSSEQRTKIRKVVVSKKIPKVTKVNFTVSIGAHVPRTVKFHPIPTEIVTIHPAWRGYRVILVGSELLIINPRTYEIVDVIVV